MKINQLKSVFLLSALALPCAALAQVQGGECPNPGSIRVALSSAAQTEVEHDELVLSFTALSKGQSAAQASQKSNQNLGSKLAYFKSLPGVKDVRTSISSYQDYQSKGWVGQAQVTVVLDFNKGQGVDIQSQPFGVSSTTTRASEALILKSKFPLVQEAVKELGQKGSLLSAAAGKKSFTLKSMDLQDGQGSPGMVQPMVARAMSSDVPELSTGNVTQGKSQVEVRINSVGCID